MFKGRRKKLFRTFYLPGIPAPVLSALITLVSAAALTVLIIMLNSPAPLKTLAAFFTGPWSSPWFFGNTLDKIALLLTASLGAAVGFRGGTFNLGGEGQIYLGGLAASVVLLRFPSGADGLALFLAAFAALLTGGAMGAVSGLLKRKLRANELITSLLLSMGLSPLGDYLIGGAWRDRSGNLLALPAFSSGRVLPRILPPSSLSISFIFAVLLVLIFHVYLNRTVWGYRFKIGGAAPDFAHYGGIDPGRAWTPAMSMAGALSGLAGFFAVAGTYGRCHLGFPGGLGWNAIAVALIARNNPPALFPAALVYGWLETGSSSALLGAGLNFETSFFIQALVLFLATVHFGLPLIRSRGGAPRRPLRGGKPR
jgi:simple sugar transport system permease protein